MQFSLPRRGTWLCRWSCSWPGGRHRLREGSHRPRASRPWKESREPSRGTGTRASAPRPSWWWGGPRGGRRLWPPAPCSPGIPGGLPGTAPAPPCPPCRRSCRWRCWLHREWPRKKYFLKFDGEILNLMSNSITSMESSTLFRMMSIWDFFSSSESPSMFFSALAMIFICLRIVDLPLSPVPRRRSFVICDFFRKSSFRSFFINLVRFNICKISLILQNLWQTYLYGRPPWRGPCSCPWCTSFAPWGHVIVKLLICTDSHHRITSLTSMVEWHPDTILEYQGSW